MKIKMILPALTEAKSPYWRPVKYSLFPPLGLATLAAYCGDEDEVILQDEHVEELVLGDEPDIVVIQVYITNAFRSYELAKHYKKKVPISVLEVFTLRLYPVKQALMQIPFFLGLVKKAGRGFCKILKMVMLKKNMCPWSVPSFRSHLYEEI
jgi:hypothetical protein